MGDVGVDPDQVAKAATALEQLRDALAANVPTIVNTMSSYAAGVNTAVLKQAQARSVGDAADMRARSNLALAWMSNPENIDGTYGGLAFVPWSGQALDNADAKFEAQALALAESSSDPTIAAQQLQGIEQDLKDHMSDSAWLGAFYSNAAPYVAKLATTLHNLDANGQQYNNRFTVLTQSDQQVLATFAKGLAAADKSGTLTPEAVQAIANAPDIWSAAMLIKFGPPGSAWATSEQKGPQNPDGLSLLAVLTDNVYKDEQTGKIKIPLGGGYNRYTADDQQQLQGTLSNYDPLTVMLKADSQNKNAAWQVMGDDNPIYGNPGPSLAKLLLWNTKDLPSLTARFVQGGPNDKGQYPGYFTISPAEKSVDEATGAIVLNFMDPSIAGAFLDASTSAPRSIDPNDLNAKYAAQAAINIIDGTPPASGDGSVKLDPALQQALTDTAQRYLVDLAMSVNNQGDSTVLKPGTQLPAWAINVNGQGSPNSLSDFLNQIASNKDDLASLDAAAKVTFGNIYAQDKLGVLPPGISKTGADMGLAGLLGRIDTAANQNGIDLAKDLDEQHEEYNKMLEFAESTVKFVPVVGEAADEYLDPTKAMLGLLGVSTEFSTDNASTAQTVAAQQFAEESTQLHVPMVQSLLNFNAPGILASAQQANAGLPPDQQWLQNGQIVLTKANMGQFNGWYEGIAGEPPYKLEDLNTLYGDAYRAQGGAASNGAQGPW